MYAEYIKDCGFENWLHGYCDTRMPSEPSGSSCKYSFYPVELNEEMENKFDADGVYYVLCDKDGNLATDNLFAKNPYGISVKNPGDERYALVSLCIPEKYSNEIMDICKKRIQDSKEWYFKKDDCVVDLETGAVVYRVVGCGYDHFLTLHGNVCVDRKKGMRAVYLPTGETVFETYDGLPKYRKSTDNRFVFFYNMSDYISANYLVRVDTATGETMDCMQ